MPPAAKAGDMIMCPMVSPPPAAAPHAPVLISLQTAKTVKIGGAPPVIMNGIPDQCPGPVPHPIAIIKGSMTVKIEKMPAVRIGDTSSFGTSVIGSGVPTVMIGG